ncbi:MAG TPA: hypothetical protein DCY13_09585 [Verrucomicrobiales bacterium]|nr:hypothetical protein [Verrucomicrobiales bacterium]
MYAPAVQRGGKQPGGKVARIPLVARGLVSGEPAANRNAGWNQERRVDLGVLDDARDVSRLEARGRRRTVISRADP